MWDYSWWWIREMIMILTTTIHHYNMHTRAHLLPKIWHAYRQNKHGSNITFGTFLFTYTWYLLTWQHSKHHIMLIHIQWKERGEKADVNNLAPDTATLLKTINFPSYISAKQFQMHISTLRQMWNSLWLNVMKFLQTPAVSVPNNADSLQVTGVSFCTEVADYCDDWCTFGEYQF